MHRCFLFSLLLGLLLLLGFFFFNVLPLLLGVSVLDVLILAHSDSLSLLVIFAIPLHEQRLLGILLNRASQLLLLVDIC